MNDNPAPMPDPGKPKRVGYWGDVILILGGLALVLYLFFTA